jgi:hypothetical protein
MSLGGSKFPFKAPPIFEENCDFLKPKNYIFRNIFGTSFGFHKSAKKFKNDLNPLKE